MVMEVAEISSVNTPPDLSSVVTTGIPELSNVNINTVSADLCESPLAIGDGNMNSMIKTEDSSTSNDSIDIKKDDSENVLRFESGIADGYIILSREAAASLGMNSAEDTEGVEPATKRFRFQGEDGQSYVLTVADNTVTGTDIQTATDLHTKLQEGTTLVDIEGEDHGIPVAPAVPETDVTGETPVVASSSNSKKTTGINSSDVTQAWFTTRFEKAALHSKGASWKQGQWTKDEIDILQCNIDSYCRDRGISDPTEIIFGMSKDERKDFYRTVAKGLQRPLFSVYRRVTRMYDQKNHMGKYSPDEMNRLRELRGKLGNDWASIGAVLGRSASSVKDKCRLMKDTCNSGKWLPEEEQRLSAAVYQLAGVKMGENVTGGLSWASVAERVGTRSEKQCRTKWLNYLNWKQKGGTEWTREDDINLVIKISNLGVSDDTEIDWAELATNWPSVRSPQWLRGKWWSLKRHVPDYQLVSFPDLVEYLKTIHLQNVRMKNPVSSNIRVSALSRTNTADVTTLHLPVSLGHPTIQSVPLQTTTSLEGGGIEGEAALQTYEILHQTSSGAFLITQPQTNPVISLSGSAVGTDHIIVHTLPSSSLSVNENVAVQMNPTPVILSAVPSGDSVVEGVTTLDTADISTIQLSDTITHSESDLQTLESDQIDSIKGELNVTEAELDTSSQLHTESQIIHTQVAFESQAITESDIGTVPEVSHADIVNSNADTSELVLASTTSPQFVPSSSNSELMSSLSDPMLPSGGGDLIGSSSDIEGDKGNSQITDITSTDISGHDS